MPIDDIPRGCIAIYAQVAENLTTDVQLDLKYKQATGAIVLSNIDIKRVVITEQTASKLNDKAVEVKVKIKVEFAFNGNVESMAIMERRNKGAKWFVFEEDDIDDDFDFCGCDSLIVEHRFPVKVTSQQKVCDIRPAVNLVADVKPGDFDRFEMTQTYDIRLSGSIISTILKPEIVVVRKG